MKNIHTTARLPEDLIKKIKAQAVTERRSYNNMIVCLLEDSIKHKKAA